MGRLYSVLYFKLHCTDSKMSRAKTNDFNCYLKIKPNISSLLTELYVIISVLRATYIFSVAYLLVLMP